MNRYVDEAPMSSSAPANGATSSGGRPRIVVAQLGARRHYAVPRIVHDAGMLARLYTDTYVGDKPWLERLLGLVPKHWLPERARRLRGRKALGVPADKVTSLDLFGLRYERARRRAERAARPSAAFAYWGKRFCVRIVAGRPPQADLVWAFNGAALELFQWAKGRGMRCVLEQTSAPHAVMRRLVSEEVERWPGWEPGLEPPPEPDPLSERERAEWRLADLVIAGSQFVVAGIEACDGPADKCVVVPGGVDAATFTPRPRGRSDRLRVLFAGRVCLMKGAPYLLEALRRLGPRQIQARFAGEVALAPDKLRPYREVAVFLGPVPRPLMPQLYRWADVLVLPSICEGSAMVVYEALSAGTYVITTPNAGSVLEGSSPHGQLVPIRDVDALVAALGTRLAAQADDRPQQTDGLPVGVDLAAYRHRLIRVVDGMAALPHALGPEQATEQAAAGGRPG